MKKTSFNILTFGVVIICITAVIFTVFSIYSTSKLSKQINSIYTDTYMVKGEIEIIRSRLTEIRLTLPTILENDNSKQKNHIIDMLAERDALQDESLANIRKYLGDIDTIDRMELEFSEIRAARLTAVDIFSPQSDVKDINNYMRENVDPFHNEIIKCLNTLEIDANNRVESIHTTAAVTKRVASTGSVFLCLLIIFMVVINNITEVRRTKEIHYRNELFDLLSNTIDNIFFIYSLDNKKYEYVSTNTNDILGVETKEFYDRTLYLTEFFDNESKELFSNLFTDAITTPKECDLKYSRNCKNMNLKLKVFPVLSKNKVNRYIAVLSDQTKMIEQRNILNDALLSAQQANDAKRNFLSHMSHEIRTPMNTIVGMTAIALRHIDDKSYIENSLNKITLSSNHLLSLINDILDMSKIEDNKLLISNELFDLKKVIDSVNSIVYPQTISKKQHFDITIINVTEEKLIGDSLRINQILLNLLSNAVKFTPEDGTIKLEISKTKTKGRYVFLKFVVSDTGIGMNTEFMEKIFNPFEQESGSITQKYGGTGLGMSITKNLIDLMNGTIFVESKPNVGTQFIIELPFGIAETEIISCPPELSNLNVLIVDDDQNTCEHAIALMDQFGINASSALNGKAAVEKVFEAHENNKDYDVCFIDWCMPEMNGIETTRVIREQLGPETLIIIISAYDISEIENEAREAGVNAFITKPIFASSIFNALNTVVAPKFIGDKNVSGDLIYSGKKILLAEDNEINQEICIMLLKDIGISIDCAENGNDAVNMFLNSKPNEYSMILMDIQMPVMNGYDATRTIRSSEHENAKDIPILAMTANAFSEDIVNAKASGMNGHIAKPIDVDLLYKTISEYMPKELTR